MKVVVTEKPSVAQDIAKVLNCTSKKQGWYEGNNYIITWAFGHLIELYSPEDYSESLKSWSLDSLPIIPETFKTKPVQDNGAVQQYNTISKLINNPSVSEVICATDAGREGELIFRYIYEHSGCTKDIKRLWISSQTDEAIKEGFSNLKPGSEYDGLFDSAVCRSEADWLIGMNASRAYTVKCSNGTGVMSVGRVQTPVLKMIVDRYRENQSFEPKSFYELRATFKHAEGSYDGIWFDKDRETRMFNQADADALYETLSAHKDGKVASLTKKIKREQPPLLYDLTELQKDANKKYKFSADETLKIMQSLYEKHKVLTYPRTSSRFLSKDILAKLPEKIANLKSSNDFKDIASKIEEKQLAISSRIINDKKVTDHHAIIPTEKKANPSQFSPQEKMIYDLVIKRFLAAYLGDCVKNSTEIITEISGHPFKSLGSIIMEQGWREAYLDDSATEKDDDLLLPAVAKNDPVTVEKLEKSEGKTKAPPLYNEASILAAMETAGRQCNDDELREAMKECGLGTPATRAQILEKLIRVNYITRSKNKLSPTEKGEYLIDSIQDDELLSPDLTGQWEKKLNDMALKQYSRTQYMKEIEAFTRTMTQKVMDMAVTSAPLPEHLTSLGPCPMCGGDVVETPKSYGCYNWKTAGCKFSIWKETGGKVIKPAQAKQILKNGKTDKVIKGFVSKAGKKFDAFLGIQDKKVVFLFDNTVESLGTCPACSEGDIVESAKAYSCNKWKESGCNYVIWKEISSRKINVEEAKVILKDGKTEKLSGFKSKAGKAFEAALTYKNGRVEFLF